MTGKKRLVFVLVIVMVFSMMGGLFAQESTPTYTEVWDGRGTDSLRCDLVGQEGRPATGWIHWVFSTKGDSTDATLVLGGTGSGTYSPGAPLNAEVWHFYTPYFELDGLTATINLFGGLPGPGGGLVISDYCPGGYEELTVSKTAVTSYTRDHDWSIAKKVETENGYELDDGTPKIWLYTDGSGDETATWTVDVTYDGYTDSDFNVSGAITIENTGTLDAVITGIVDKLSGNVIPVQWKDEDDNPVAAFPYTLEVGKKLFGSYDEDVAGKITGYNRVWVKTEEDVYRARAAIVWGNPAAEGNATVTVKDYSQLFGKVTLGTLNAADYEEGDKIPFTYDKDFSFADYEECGSYSYRNTARLYGDCFIGAARAVLKVNVQCYNFEGETAWAANGNMPLELRYTPRGNWATYVKYEPDKMTTLFAGQTIPVGTVHFSAAEGGKVTITVSLSGDWEFEDVAENLKVQDYAIAPSGNPAPGQFDWKANIDSNETIGSLEVPLNKFYGVHVNVGQWVPDPNFGP